MAFLPLDRLRFHRSLIDSVRGELASDDKGSEAGCEPYSKFTTLLEYSTGDRFHEPC